VSSSSFVVDELAFLCGEKSPIVPHYFVQLFSLRNIRDLDEDEDEDDDEHEDESSHLWRFSPEAVYRRERL